MSSDKLAATPEAASTPEDSPPPPARDAAPGRTRGRLMLLLVLAAAGAGGYLYWKLQQPVRPPTAARFEEPRPAPAKSLAPSPNAATPSPADPDAAADRMAAPQVDDSQPVPWSAADTGALDGASEDPALEDALAEGPVSGASEEAPSLAGDVPQPPAPDDMAPAPMPDVELPAAPPAIDAEAVFARIADLEAAVAALAAAPAPAPAPPAIDMASLTLAEARDLVALAEQRLALARDTEGAMAALRLAASRLASEAFQAPRRAIRDDLAALEAFRDFDVAALSSELATLARQALSLPLAAGDSSLAADGTQPPVDDWRGLLAAVGTSLRGLVEVRETDESRDPLLNPAHAALARQQLALDLSVARVAVLQRDAAEFRAALAPAIAALQAQFDGANGAVTDALARLRELGDLDLAPPLPGLARSAEALSTAASTSAETAL